MRMITMPWPSSRHAFRGAFLAFWALLASCCGVGTGLSWAGMNSLGKGMEGSWLTGFNFKYTIVGVGQYQPSQVFDDGVNTWIQFEELRAHPLVLAQREHTPLSFKQEGDFVVISGVYEHLLLHVLDEGFDIIRNELVSKDSSGLAREKTFSGSTRLNRPEGSTANDAVPSLTTASSRSMSASASSMPVEPGFFRDLSRSNVNRFESRLSSVAPNSPSQLSTANSRGFETMNPSISSSPMHSYAAPVSGDTLHYLGEDAEHQSQDESADSRLQFHDRYVIDFLPKQSHLETAALKRVSSLIKTLPKAAQLSLSCIGQTYSTGLNLWQRKTPSLAESRTSLKSSTSETSLFALRWDYLAAFIFKAGFAKHQLQPKLTDAEFNAFSHESCLNSVMLEWSQPSLSQSLASPKVMLSDETLLKALQRLGEREGWRVVATDAPSVPIVKEVLLTQVGFVDLAKVLITWANQAGFEVKGVTHEGHVLLLSKGEGLE